MTKIYNRCRGTLPENVFIQVVELFLSCLERQTNAVQCGLLSRAAESLRTLLGLLEWRIGPS